MTELEELLRADLHRAAQPVDIPVSLDATVAQHERQRRVRAIVLIGGVGAAVVLLALVLLPAVTRQPGLQATVDPRTAPTATSSATMTSSPTPTPSPSGTPSTTPSATPGTVGTALNLPAMGGRLALKLTVKPAANGSGLVFSDPTGRSATVDRADGINWTPDVPSAGVGVGVLPAEAVWAEVLPTGDPGSWPVTQVVVTKVPGSDLVALAFRYETGTIASAPPSVVWGRANGAVYNGRNGCRRWRGPSRRAIAWHSSWIRGRCGGPGINCAVW